MKRTLKTTVRTVVALVLIASLIVPAALLSYAGEAQNAIDAAASGATVKLTADCSEALTVPFGKTITLDLAGHTVSAAITNNGTLTLIDSVGTGSVTLASNAGTRLSCVVNNGTMILDGAALSSTGNGNETEAVGIYNTSSGKLTVKSGSITSITNANKYGFGILNEGTVEDFAGGSITVYKNSTNWGNNVVGIANKGTVKKISGGSIYVETKGNNGYASAVRNQNNATVELISGGKLYACTSGSGSSYAFAIRNESGTVKSITGGEITAYTTANQWCFGIDNQGSGTVESISGGVISAIIDHQNEAPNAIAFANLGKVGTISGGTLYAEHLGKDGAAIAYRNNANNATLDAITGGSFIAKCYDGANNKAFGLYNQNGTIKEISGGLIYGYTAAKYWAFGLWNGSKINKISGGTFVAIIDHKEGTNPNAIAFSNDSSSAEMTLSGGVFYSFSDNPTGGAFAIRNRAKITFSGGAFYNNKTANSTILTEGGTTVYADGYTFVGGAQDAASTFESGYKYVVPTGAEVAESYVDGDLLKHATVSTTSGKAAEYVLYGTAINVVALDKVPYTSIEEAAFAAEANATLVLLDDIKGTSVVPEGAQVIIDLAGKSIEKLTVNGQVTVIDTVGGGSVEAVDGEGAVTIKDGTIGDIAASATVSGGIITGDVGTDLKANGGAFVNAVSDSSLIDGYVLTEKSENGYYYVVEEGGSAVELYDSVGQFIGAYFFNADRERTSEIGSVEKEGYILVGWAEELGERPNIADDDVDGSYSALYATHAKKPTYYFLGSSVTYGSATGGRSFVEELAELVPIEYDKQAVSGTTLVDNGASSYVQRMLNNFDKNGTPDRLIVQLSTNDASQNKALGTLAEGTDLDDFDTSTVIGAIEYIIAYAKETWGCEVSFYTNPKYSSQAYVNMIDALYDVQDKWGIGIIDFYYYVDMEELSDATLASYMSDSIHPNSTGYKWMAGVMADALIENDHECCGLYVVTKDAGCTDNGSAETECVICGEAETEELQATGHDFVDGSCSVCGEEEPPADDTTEPECPTQMFVKDKTTTTITLTWTASPSEDVVKYVIFDWITREVIGETTETEYVMTGLTPATSYNVAVRAEDAAGNESSAQVIEDETLAEDEPEEKPETGDALVVIALVALLSLAGVALISKKRALTK